MERFPAASIIVLEGPTDSGRTTAAKQLAVGGKYVDLNQAKDVSHDFDSYLVLDNFQPKDCEKVKALVNQLKSMDCPHTPPCQNYGIMIICQDAKDLGTFLLGKVDYYLRRFTLSWDLMATKYNTTEVFVVNVYPEDIAWLISKVKEQEVMLEKIKRLLK